MAKVCRCVYISASTCFWCCVSVKRSFKIFKGEPKQLRLLSLHGHCTPRHTLAACLIVLCGITVLILGQRPVSNNTWITLIWTSVTWPNFDDNLLIVWHKFDILFDVTNLLRPASKVGLKSVLFWTSSASTCGSRQYDKQAENISPPWQRNGAGVMLVKPWNRPQDVTRCHKFCQWNPHWKQLFSGFHAASSCRNETTACLWALQKVGGKMC